MTVIPAYNLPCLTALKLIYAIQPSTPIKEFFQYFNGAIHNMEHNVVPPTKLQSLMARKPFFAILDGGTVLLRVANQS